MAEHFGEKIHSEYFCDSVFDPHTCTPVNTTTSFTTCRVNSFRVNARTANLILIRIQQNTPLKLTIMASLNYFQN